MTKTEKPDQTPGEAQAIEAWKKAQAAREEAQERIQAAREEARARYLAKESQGEET